MKDTLDMAQSAGVVVVRANQPKDEISAKGRFTVEHWRDGEKIGEYAMPNAITDEGRSKLLDVMFHGSAAITTWYMGLVDSTSYTAQAAGDGYTQLASANGWRENTYYTDTNNSDNAGTRPVWGAGSPGVTSHLATTTNATVAIFTVTSGGSGTVKGLFIAGGTSAQTKSDVASGNVLWSAALFTSGDVAVLSGDQLKVTYSVSA